MPSVSGKQARFMAMCAHDPEHARGTCPSMKVAREYNRADKGSGMLSRAVKRVHERRRK